MFLIAFIKWTCKFAGHWRR